MPTSKTRKLSASLEDYLEAILNLSAGSKVARSKDIADTLEVSRSSVTGAVRTLAQKQLVNYKPYGFITLTGTGRILAEKVARRHNIIKSFFVNVLSVDPTTAGQAACKAEHALGSEIITRLLHFIEFVTANNNNGVDLAKQFTKFCARNDNNLQSNNKEQR
ncbi:MAG: metal-dependent transcriptional regulator [Planctomycetota bacterium]|jgi:DtxR family Mn-dependent transcriptional regulator